jgi:hypothetical protein
MRQPLKQGRHINLQQRLCKTNIADLHALLPIIVRLLERAQSTVLTNRCRFESYFGCLFESSHSRSSTVEQRSGWSVNSQYCAFIFIEYAESFGAGRTLRQTAPPTQSQTTGARHAARQNRWRAPQARQSMWSASRQRTTPPSATRTRPRRMAARDNIV